MPLHLCHKCKKQFKTRKTVSKYCSQVCFHDSRKGIIRPEHSRRMTGEGNSRWKGGKIFDKDGYYLIYNPKHPKCNATGYVREHRLAMEGQLGRYLNDNEIVHHINENKKDNRIENLMVLSKEEHDRHHFEKRFKKIVVLGEEPFQVKVNKI